MERKIWALLTYIAQILLVVALLNFSSTAYVLHVTTLVIFNLANLLLLLSNEKNWNNTHYAATFLLILTGSYVLLSLLGETLYTRELGIAVTIATAVLFGIEFVDNYRTYNLLDRIMEERT